MHQPAQQEVLEGCLLVKFPERILNGCSLNPIPRAVNHIKVKPIVGCFELRWLFEA